MQTTSDTTQINNPLSVMQAGEKVICQIRRHPVGLIGIYIGTGLFVIALAAIYLFGLRALGIDTSQTMRIGGAVAALLVALAFLNLFVELKIYYNNRWILTSDSLTQVQQTGLFSQQSSQLSLGSLEDITAEQNGIMTHLFNYGTLKVETAGERSKFWFPFCPDPNYYAQQVLDAREKFQQQNPGAGQV